MEQEKQLIGKKAACDSKHREILQINSQASEVQHSIKGLNLEIDSLKVKNEQINAELLQESELKAQAQKYAEEKANLKALEEAADKYIRLSNELSQLEKQKADAVARFKEGGAVRATQLNGLKEKAKLLDESGCIDIQNAKCRFLKDALKAKADIEPYTQKCHEWKVSEKAKITKIEADILSISNSRNELNYDADNLKTLRKRVSELESAKARYGRLNGAREQAKLISERVDSIAKEISSQETRLNELQLKENQLNSEYVVLKSAAAAYDDLKKELDEAKTWLAKEKQLPVMKERISSAKARITAIDKDISLIVTEISAFENDYDSEMQAAAGLW